MGDGSLIKVPPGWDCSVVIDEFVESYARNPFGTYLLLPTSRLSEDLRRNIARKGVAVISDNVTTPEVFASGIVSQYGGGLRLLSDEEAKLVLSGVVRKDRDALKVLSRTGEYSARILNDLYSLFGEFDGRMRESVSDGMPNSARIKVLERIRSAYERELSDNGSVAPSGVYKAACRSAENFCRERRPVFFVYGIFSPSESFKGFINGLISCGADVRYYLPYYDNGSVFSDRGEWLSLPEKAPAGSDSIDTGIKVPYADLFSGNPVATPGVQTVYGRFPSFQLEAEAIAGTVASLIRRGVSPGKIAVALPDLAGGTTLLSGVFSDFSVPFSSSATLSLGRYPVVHAAMLPLEVVLGDFKRDTIYELLSSPYFTHEYDPHLIEAAAKKAMIEGGFGDWSKLAGLYRMRLEKISTDEERDLKERLRAEGELKYAEVLAEFAASYPEILKEADVKDTISGHIRRYRDILSKLRFGVSPDAGCAEDDIRYGEYLAGLFDRLSSGNGGDSGDEITFKEFAGFLYSSVAGMRVPFVRERDKVQITGMQELLGADFDYLFLAGLTGGKIPVLPGLFPYLTEKEEQILWPKKKRDKISREKLSFIYALIAAGKGLYLSCHDDDSGSPAIPSQFLQVFLDSCPADEWEASDGAVSVLQSVKDAGRMISGGCFTPVFCPDLFVLSENSGLLSPASLAGRINTESFCRTGDYDSAYDGILEDADIIGDIGGRFGPEKAFSPTALETYAVCPFRFYLSSVLGLERIEEADVTLSASERGSIIHDILFRFYTEWMKENSRAPGECDIPAAKDLILSLTDEVTGEFRRNTPAWNAMLSELTGDTGFGTGIMERFLEEEASFADSEFVPALFEASFGTDKPGISSEPAKLVSVSGDEIRVRGFVDRIDETADGRFAITDYKTGSHPKLKDIVDGKALQLPLYLKAYESFSEKRGVGGFYYTVKRKEVSRKAEIYDESESDLFSSFKKSRSKDALFADIVDDSVSYACSYAKKIRLGIFSPASEAGVCPDYCDFKFVCRYSDFRILSQSDSAADSAGDEGVHRC
ncbi:PD-(D/E)XK nuclease family protein [Methanoplanus endosymbiosus]|uniref:PD-(D/E)XK nuclease family protein n=1 Tax=Methanoplanus endosymbiosus TaxID=33865 RepID=A0A9E7PK42_9EURY|nr:PD-(D/E)XK nuclease family protein [Methanoplanus endosymbiosus]UUX91493.1 PD-(D/E)XK nuclease family protein [Methanoplanus endosymbiosus]